MDNQMWLCPVDKEQESASAYDVQAIWGYGLDQDAYTKTGLMSVHVTQPFEIL